MIITDRTTTSRNKPKPDQSPQEGDLLNMQKINSLSGPLTARFLDGYEWTIESIDIQTGLMRIDVCGQIDLESFSMVRTIIDGEGIEHESDDFYLDN